MPTFQLLAMYVWLYNFCHWSRFCISFPRLLRHAFCCQFFGRLLLKSATMLLSGMWIVISHGTDGLNLSSAAFTAIRNARCHDASTIV